MKPVSELTNLTGKLRAQGGEQVRQRAAAGASLVPSVNTSTELARTGP